MMGLVYGLGMFGVGISWVFVSCYRFTDAHWSVAVLLTAMLVSILALFFLGFARIFKQITGRISKQNSEVLLIFPSLWILLEWLRSTIATGFPWLLLGVSQTETPLAGFAPLGGVYGVSWLVAFLGAVTVYALRQVQAKIFAGPMLVLSLSLFVWGGGYFLRTIQWTQPHPDRYLVSLVQGNLSPIEKFSEQEESNLQRYYRLTQPLADSQIIVWPENAITHARPDIDPVLNRLDEQARQRDQTWIMGLPSFIDPHYYNTLLAIGSNQQAYHKVHLLPFGDYVPFEDLLRGLIQYFDLPLSSFRPGASDQPNLSLKTWLAAPAICYEIAYAETVRQKAALSHLLLTISEDGWFGDSWGPHQHLQIAQMRAIENQKPVIRSTTSGISAFINEKGKILKQAPQFQALTLSRTMEARQGQTPWNHLGQWPVLSFALICLAWGVWANRKNKEGFRA